VNSIFKSMKWLRGDKILILDCAYEMVRSTAQYLVDEYQIEVVKLPLDKDVINSDEKILQRFEEILKKEGPIKLAAIDHIPSVPHVILPIKEIVAIFRKYNVPVFVDGAHAVGQIPIDVKDINADFYLSNFHKWGYVPKSVSFMHVSKEFQSKVHPNVITAKYKTGFSNEYSYVGTKDYTAIFTIKDALDFRKMFGDRDIMDYMNNLAWEAGKEVAKIWGTEMLIIDKCRIGSMANVRIPFNDEQLLRKAVDVCLTQHNTFIVVYKHNDGNFYTRMSAQIYNELSDYTYAAEKYLQVVHDLMKAKENLK